ncbi:NUDIX domain-containing protein [Roseimicrobium gellanilyticum]|uniref:NUDIX domain-containing protein n=1 Tax=Roseimicrobium gellanilyticum TaxID=748857 RepID=UPI00147276C1|nr:NUDIX domain-containing protein [Roseimicrobium gellanilyticum]
MRKGPSGYELLVFEHPLAGRQIPKGTIESGEDPSLAALRELEEESGIKAAGILSRIAKMEILRTTSLYPHKEVPRLESWHLYHLEVPQEVTTREHWVHAAEGSADEQGLPFAYFWFPIESSFESFEHYWHEVLLAVQKYCAGLSLSQSPTDAS